jgi:phosphoserine aminotransferase
LKASQEAARHLGTKHINVVTDSRTASTGRFVSIPDESQWKLTPTVKEGGSVGPAVVYYCDNETVDGVEFPAFPACLEAKSDDEEEGRLVVADMSSNILSRRVDVRNYAVIFAGAQKNIGTTGLTIVILRKSLLPPRTNTAPPALLRELGLPIGPVILDYATVAKNNSLYNTLSIFDVWVAGQVIEGLLTRFPEDKVGGMEKLANEKASLVYGALDKYPEVYTVVPEKAARSRMNICFRIASGNDEVEKQWLAGAEQRGLLGLKGHRSVGGIRCSNCEL